MTYRWRGRAADDTQPGDDQIESILTIGGRMDPGPLPYITKLD